MEMDIDDDDLDVDNDPIKTLLRHRLAAIKARKKEAEETLGNLKKFIRHMQNKTKDNGGLRITDVWKKVYNGKFVIGIEIEHTSKIPIRNILPIIQWQQKSATRPIYRTKLFTEKSPSVKNFLAISIDQPDFAAHSSYTADICLAYNGQEKAILDPLVLQIDDLSSRELEVKTLHVVGSKKDAVISALSCLKEIKLAVSDSEQVKLLYLNEVEFNEDKYYVFDDGGMLQVAEEKLLIIFYRDKTHLLQILHYLSTNLKDFTILPAQYKNFLPSNSKEDLNFLPSTQNFYVSQQQEQKSAESATKFRKLLRQEIGAVLDFHKEVLDNKACGKDSDVSSKIGDLREFLAELEYESDVLYEQIN